MRRTHDELLKLYVALIILVPCMLRAIEIPKSSLSLEVPKLEAAKNKKDRKLIARYQAELDKIEKKIEKFELEWLQYRKKQLKAKPADASITKRN